MTVSWLDLQENIVGALVIAIECDKSRHHRHYHPLLVDVYFGALASLVRA